MELAGLLVDYGGVLTNPLAETMSAWCELDGVDVDEFRRVMRELLGPRGGRDAAANPVHALERGELAIPDFERELAARLRTRSGAPVRAEGLLNRMFAAFRADPVMFEAVRRARAAGMRTAVVSNSWGLDYPRQGWDGLFDAVVISGEVGMRKPEPAIYRFAAEQVGLGPAQCVFVDDLRPNVEGAARVGMQTVLHRAADSTVEQLEGYLGITLRAPAARA